MWEYKVVGLSVRGSAFGGKKVEWEEQVNELGRDNWELVAAFASSVGLGGTSGITLIFKRPLPK